LSQAKVERIISASPHYIFNFCMNLVITDSGLGGLSVCAQLMALLKESTGSRNLVNLVDGLKISYINAVPANKRGYNSMSGKVEQISTFEKILRNTKKLIKPNYIFVACGTLSVLLKDMQFKRDNNSLIEGILPLSFKLILDNLHQNSQATVLIFGTPTTINANTFQNEFSQNGIEKSRIIIQACPELATQISNDPEGSFVVKRIRYWVQQALSQLAADNSGPFLVFLGCTHYAYRENLFRKSFILEGYSQISILNPNLVAANSLSKIVLQDQGTDKSQSTGISLEFLTPYVIPQEEIITLSQLLIPISVETAAAFQNAIISPELLA
jgi:glutamate racemase